MKQLNQDYRELRQENKLYRTACRTDFLNGELRDDQRVIAG